MSRFFGRFDSLGAAFSAVVAASLVGIGVGSLVVPRTLARNYGIPVDDASAIAYVRGLGVRDAAIGLMIVAFLARRDRDALATTIGISTLLGTADFLLVATTTGAPARPSLTIHATGTIGLFAGYALLRAGL